MKASGRNNPCPVCQRVKDADCRWNDTTILCHTGTDMRPGDTLTIAGQQWAFIRHDGGFSGSAAVFKPHIPRPASSPSAPIRRPEPFVDGLSRAQWDYVFNQFHKAFDTAWRLPDLYTCTPSELKDCIAVINEAQQMATAIRQWLSQVWRVFPDLDQCHRQRIDAELRHIAFIAEDLRSFQQNELGYQEDAA